MLPLVTMVPISYLADWRLCDDEFMAAFALSGPVARLDVLHRMFPLPRESRILFFPDTHTYMMDGVIVPRSVTGLVHEYQTSLFDAHSAINFMKQGRNLHLKRLDFINDCGQEMSNPEICALWQSRANVASARGVLLHYHAEAVLNGLCIEEPHSPELQKCLMIVSTLSELGWQPFRTEVCLAHIGLCVCGQPDALFRNDAGEHAIVDWKRCKDVTFENSFRTLKEPLDHLAECNGNLYALQLNMYRFYAFACINLNIVFQYLCCIEVYTRE